MIMDLVNQTFLYAVTSSNHLAFFLLIKILALSNNTVVANVTDIQTNGVLLNYTVSLPLFLFYYNGSGIPAGQIDGAPVYSVNLPGYEIYVDSYNGLVLAYVNGDGNFTLNGSTVPLGPGVYVPLHVPNFNPEPDYTPSVTVLTAVLVSSFYFLFKRRWSSR
jgi:hypothetical protein